MKNGKRAITSVLIGIVIYVQFGPIISLAFDSNQSETAFSAVRNSSMMPLMWTIIIIGGCIAVTLSYVSWRKYKGEKNRESEKDKSVD